MAKLLAPGRVLDPVCGMTIPTDDASDTSTTKAARTTSASPVSSSPGPILTVSLRPPGASRGAAGPGRDTRVRWIRRSARRGPASARNAAWRWSRSCPSDYRRVDLPDASGDRPRRAGRVPDLRDGAGAPGVTLEEKNPELDDMSRRFSVSAVITAPILAFMVSELLPAMPLHLLRTAGRTGSARARDPRRAVGRVAVLRARLGFGREPSPEHVHADRARRRRGLRFQRRRDVRARTVSRSSAMTRRGRLSTSSRGGHRRAGAPRPGARTARPQPHRRRDPGSAGPRAEDRAQDRGDGRRGRSARAVVVGDRLRVRPGEQVPVDGVVLEGTSDRRRIDGHRRADPGEKSARRSRAAR